MARLASSTRVESPGAAKTPETAETARRREEKLTMVAVLFCCGSGQVRGIAVDDHCQWLGNAVLFIASA